MTYNKAVEIFSTRAYWWHFCSLCLYAIAFTTMTFALACYGYGELYYWIPSSRNAFSILLSGLLAAVFAHQIDLKGERWSDKAETVSMFAKTETVEIKLEKVLVSALGQFFDKSGRINFTDLDTFKDLQLSLKQFCLSTSASIEETDKAVCRLLHNVANSELLKQVAKINPYVEVGKLKLTAFSELAESLRGDIETLQKAVKAAENDDTTNLEVVLAMVALKDKLQPIVEGCRRGDTASVIALDATRPRHAAE